MDEAFSPFGVGAEIAAQIADRGFDDLDAPIRRLNGVHTPTPYSPPLEAAVVPNVAAIVGAIRELWTSEDAMPVEIKVPRLGWSMEEGTFVEWLKRDGEFVEAGQPLFAIEGDKAIQDVEAIGSGILRISPRLRRAVHRSALA